MKNSGIPWIGEIPEKWKVDILSVLFFEHKCKNIGMREKNLLSLSYGNIIKKDINTSEGLLPESFETYNIIDKGDIIFRLTDLQNDKRSLRTGLCKEKGIITSAYVCLRKRSTNSSEYFHYLFHAYDICKVFYGYGGGVRQGMNYEDLRKLPIVFPPFSEQQAIADFLDKKCAEIDQMVALQEKFIEELKAYKQSLITETVTKGLNPNAPMKDSGVEWIGEIPEGWEMVRIKNVCNTIAGTTPQSDNATYWDGDIKWVTPADYKTSEKWIIQGRRNISEIGRISCHLSILPKETVVFSKRAPIGQVGITLNELCINQGCIGCITNDRIYPTILYYILSIYTEQFDLLGSGTTFKEISATNFANFLIAVPPLSEQQTIADFLDKKCSEIDQLIAIKQKKADELKEYKKSIIYEYVTGKKEING